MKITCLGSRFVVVVLSERKIHCCFGVAVHVHTCLAQEVDSCESSLDVSDVRSTPGVRRSKFSLKADEEVDDNSDVVNALDFTEKSTALLPF